MCLARLRTAKGIAGGFSHPSPWPLPVGRGCSGQLFLSRSIVPPAADGFRVPNLLSIFTI